MKKRLLAIALALMLALTLLPTAAYATEGGENTQNEIIRRTCSLCKQYCRPRNYSLYAKCRLGNGQ